MKLIIAFGVSVINRACNSFKEFLCQRLYTFQRNYDYFYQWIVRNAYHSVGFQHKILPNWIVPDQAVLIDFDLVVCYLCVIADKSGSLYFLALFCTHNEKKKFHAKPKNVADVIQPSHKFKTTDTGVQFYLNGNAICGYSHSHYVSSSSSCFAYKKKKKTSAK